MERQERRITVSGWGTVSTPPDLGHLRLGAQVTDRDPDTALRISNERMASVQEALANSGIAEDDIELGRFSIGAVYDYIDQRRVLRGYQVSHSLSVTVRQIVRTGEILSVAVNAGADDVNGVSFSVEDPSSSIDRARERAFENARHKAENLARLAGERLGRVISMREVLREPVPTERYEAHAAEVRYAVLDQPSDVPINPGDSEFSVWLEVVWEIANGE